MLKNQQSKLYLLARLIFKNPFLNIINAFAIIETLKMIK